MREQSQLADNPPAHSSSHCRCLGEPRYSVLLRPQRSCLWQTETLTPSGQTAQIQQQDVDQEWQVYPQAGHPSSQPAPSTQDFLHHLQCYPTVCPCKQHSPSSACTQSTSWKSKRRQHILSPTVPAFPACNIPGWPAKPANGREVTLHYAYTFNDTETRPKQGLFP